MTKLMKFDDAMIKQESLDPFEFQEEVPGLSCAKNI